MIAGAFQAGAFQTPAFQTVAPQAQYGWAIVTAVTQTPYPVARSVYVEGSASAVTAQYYDTNGVLFVPAAVSYRVDDTISGTNVVPWTALVPAAENEVLITAAQNAMISFSRESETRQVLFEISDGFSGTYYADVFYDLVRVAGVP